ncbi:MAG: hypothetical protein L0922_07470, partial [Candidatus Mariimomonas ferrooxydans]
MHIFLGIVADKNSFRITDFNILCNKLVKIWIVKLGYFLIFSFCQLGFEDIRSFFFHFPLLPSLESLPPLTPHYLNHHSHP